MNLSQPPSRWLPASVLFGLASIGANLWLVFGWRGQVILDETSISFAIYQGLIFGQLATAAGWLVFGQRPALVRLSGGLLLIGLLGWPLAQVGSVITARPFFVAGIYLALNAIWMAGLRVTCGVRVSRANGVATGVNLAAHNLQFSLGSAMAWLTGFCLFFGLARQTEIEFTEMTKIVVYLIPFVFTAFVGSGVVCSGNAVIWRKIATMAVCPFVAGLVGTGFFPGTRGMAVFAIAAVVELLYIAVAWKLCYLAGYRLRRSTAANMSSSREPGPQTMPPSPT